MGRIYFQQLRKKLEKLLTMGKTPRQDEMKKCMKDTEREKFLDLLKDVVNNAETHSDSNTRIIMPLYKNEDMEDCKKYWGITLTSIPAKVLLELLEDSQHRFREGKVKNSVAFILLKTSERSISNFVDTDTDKTTRRKVSKKRKEVHICFVNL